ncbi:MULTISPECIES: DinB family protein [Micrococcaceae]|uniref:DinB-like domain-containing protein n=1 Tax=Paeniglutamicibacter sulfureus TaxID=43666 RepID=A0ABU2BKE2_9MICC|nr:MULTISPECIES: DinB family protein [Micrococcaceae]MDR7359110.1 hypothetical protein [Paeniglutamicibacter sulfureus]OIH85093.1 hypothetical protein BLJ79_07830 [Arthrobacter sp. UCD-GKA]
MDPDRERILAQYARAEHQLRDWLAQASPSDLGRRSKGTRWNNEELLFHMVFGYMVARALLPLHRVLSRLPTPVSAGFAAALDAASVPFDAVNYWGSKAAARFYNRHRMAARLHRVLAVLGRKLESESPAALSRAMPFPTRWDPFFTRAMTLAQLYAYPTEHFDFHAGQLDLPRGPDRLSRRAVGPAPRAGTRIFLSPPDTKRPPAGTFGCTPGGWPLLVAVAPQT